MPPPSYTLSFTEGFNYNNPPLLTLSCAIGWNLMARHDDKTLNELDALFSTDIIQGFYDETAKKYVSHRTGYDFNKTQIVKKRVGYYYYFRQAQNVVLSGINESVTLKQGWNLVGNTIFCNFTSQKLNAKTLGELKTSIGASATNAAYYDTVTKTWKTGGSISVPSGRAFMVYVSSDTIWAGQGSVYIVSFTESFNCNLNPPNYTLSFTEGFDS